MLHVHVPFVFRFPELLVFWVIMIWVMIPERRLIRDYASSAGDLQDAGTYRLIRVGNQVAMVSAVALSFFPWLLIPRQLYAFVAGTALVLLAGILRRVCFKVLGQYFTGVVRVKEDQPVIDHGPYRWTRHPSYTAGLILFLGYGVALGSWMSVAVLVVVPWMIYRQRVRAEEAALLATIGEPYRNYMSRTKRFIPFVY